MRRLNAGWLGNGWRMGEQLADQRTEHVDQLRLTAEANARVILQQQADQQEQAQRLAKLPSTHRSYLMRYPKTAALKACILLLMANAAGCASTSSLPVMTLQCPPLPAPAAWAMQPPSNSVEQLDALFSISGDQ